ncbi:tRNA wybutosine-synthesizing protein 2/3/4 isoform X2 [Cryptomeria japonica]|uniref:tRNA wybutosine-synthesizing protein 2/3/4 isoform X2 n=1 Tax=Cryptomeria japonica TaxID=3369 RepID=UPI0027DA57FE|nr:tRNA wybutosine-synthesizing protein 2/3/4 isoform X2 [Cryptomeria japonica]
MDFRRRKQQAMASLEAASDKSRKGGVDAPITDLINSINKHPSYYTTSSCSGRISILQELPPADKKLKKKAGDWIFVTHETADANQVLDLLFSQDLLNGGLVVFRFEPFILALDCSDISAAQALVASAISCGFRESGITSIGKRIMVALRCSIRMEVPIADKGQMLVPRDYIIFLVNLANNKMEMNKKRIDKFSEVFQEQGGNSPSMNKQLQENDPEHVKGKHKTDEKISNGSQESLKEHSSVAELEHRQLNILSLITELEEFVACNDDNGIGIPFPNSSASCYSEKGSPSKVFATEDGHDATCSSLVSQPQNHRSDIHKYSLQTSMVQDQSSEVCTSSGCRHMAIKMKIFGEPLEKLFRWGHSTCAAHLTSSKSLLIFGGYGGKGRHSRLNDTLILDTKSGNLKTLKVQNSPSPRMGHTAVFVGQYLFIIGGREDPTRILSDVWFFHLTEMKWHLIEFNQDILPARHRHAAAVVGSCIYVFGGINGSTIYGDLHVLDTNIMEWKRVEAKGEVPVSRHSHSLAVRGTRIYLFGGYDGSRILGDLYAYDVETGFWNEVKTKGRQPGPKFSHSIVVFNKYLAIIGGCPVAERFQELFLLDLELLVWRHLSISSISDCLLVRSTTTIVGDDLFIIGGGCSCYAFGTKFNEPLKFDMRSLIFSEQNHWLHSNNRTKQHVQISQINATNDKNSSANNTIIGNRVISRRDKPFPVSMIANARGVSDQNQSEGENPEPFISATNMPFHFSKIADTRDEHEQEQNEGETVHRSNMWILQVDKYSAKLAKDVLKKLGWLDMSRKARAIEQGSCICFPIMEEAVYFFHRNNFSFIDKRELHSSMDIWESSVVKLRKGVSKSDVSFSALLDILTSCNGMVAEGDVCSRSKEFKTPQVLLREAVALLAKQNGLSPSLLEELPSRWERLGDMAVLPMASFTADSWCSFGKELWVTVARALGVQRVARQGRIAATGTRDSTLELLLGDNGWVEHRENGIMYCFDVTKCMFSSGNVSEKLRMAKMNCRNEIVVDLFSGIGYFVLPLLLKAHAKLVYACEWNPNAIAALRHNITVNGVEDHCIILEGDNRITAPKA